MSNRIYSSEKNRKEKVSIVIPVLNEGHFLRKCLDSVLHQDYPRDLMEILIVDGGSRDWNLNIIAMNQFQTPVIKLFPNPKKIIPAALNIGILQSSGEIIIRMDAHTTYEKDYVSACVELLQTTDAVNVGAVQKATGTTYFTCAVALAISCPFGAGNAYFRYARQDMYVDTAYLGAWRKSTLIRAGGFREDWLVNEDYELNYRLRQEGGKILLSPRLRCQYYVRNSFFSLIRQYGRYGFWKVKTVKEYPDSLMPRQLIPPLFVLLFFLSLSLLRTNLTAGMIIPLCYITSNVIYSFILSARRGAKYFPLLPFIFGAVHFSWGVGFLLGMINFGLPRLRIRSVIQNFQTFRIYSKKHTPTAQM